MAKLVFSHMVSLDGFCAGPGGVLDRLPMGPAFDRHNLELLRGAGTLLFGRLTFELFQDFWPRLAQDPPADDPVLAEIATRVARADKLVVSDGLTLSADAPWRDATVLRRAQAHAAIRALKASAPRDLLAYGSRRLMQGLLAEGLVDELRLLVANVLLGEGQRLFEVAPPPLRLELLEQRRLADSELVLLRYACSAEA
ncbi:dihydrofolate reductase family protein [Roseateles sp. DAIF2]|uniref:dihydrofolate reductase family protein n=1 Tax=Roseateles sp. DAIF2 TaxID=2714952 RepID=UPI0018A313D6|nr:dihydrofolate reductase family protein [Roseateles sp. DAIF2]QPF73885.1 dihydrofolate reductase family protein [Roseateles sp. DAIF2]